MTHVPAEYWKHTTTHSSRSHGEPVGVDLFDDEWEPGVTSIYVRHTDGTRFPARTVTPDRTNDRYVLAVLQAWTARGTVNDYRNDKRFKLKMESDEC